MAKRFLRFLNKKRLEIQLVSLRTELEQMHEENEAKEEIQQLEGEAMLKNLHEGVERLRELPGYERKDGTAREKRTNIKELKE